METPVKIANNSYYQHAASESDNLTKSILLNAVDMQQSSQYETDCSLKAFPSNNVVGEKSIMQNNQLQQPHQRRRHQREISMGDILPKYESTQTFINEAAKLDKPLNFELFLKCYPNIEDLSFIGFFTVNDLMAMRHLSKECSRVLTEDLQDYLIKIGNLDDSIRINFWISHAPFFEIENELKKQFNLGSIFANVYDHIQELQTQQPISKQIANEIIIDLQRTRCPQTGALMEQSDSKMLYNVLKTIAFVLPDVGYCQGMNYIVAALFSYLKDEELTFDLFLSMIIQKGLQPLFSNGLLEYHLRIYMLDSLIKTHMPDLHSHFKKLQLNLDVIAGNWLMTIFCGYLSYAQIMPIIDNFYLINKSKLLEMNDMVYIAQHFQQIKENPNSIDIQQTLYNSYNFNVDDEQLLELEKNYFFNQAEQKLRQPQSKWTKEESQMLLPIQQFIKKTDAPLKKDLQLLQKKLKTVDTEVQKQLQICNSLKKQHQSMNEVRDHLYEKKQILLTTYTTLKRDIHTRKQMHKMNTLTQIMKKKRNQNANNITAPEVNMYPEESDQQSQVFVTDPGGNNKTFDDWQLDKNEVEQLKIQKQQKYSQRYLSTEFDAKKNTAEIKELELDVQRIEHRLSEHEQYEAPFENNYQNYKNAYEVEFNKLIVVSQQKESIMQRMNVLMMAFEDAKIAKLHVVSEQMRFQYREMYKVEFQ